MKVATHSALSRLADDTNGDGSGDVTQRRNRGIDGSSSEPLIGHELGEDESKQQLETCRQKTKDGAHDPLVDCVLAAHDDTALRGCLASRKPAAPVVVHPTPATTPEPTPVPTPYH